MKGLKAMITDREKLNGYRIMGELKLYDANLVDMEYEWVSEPNACMRCAALNGKVFKSLKDVPPRPHPNCKCRLEVKSKVRVEPTSTEAEANLLVDKNFLKLYEECKIIYAKAKLMYDYYYAMQQSLNEQKRTYERYLDLVNIKMLTKEEQEELRYLDNKISFNIEATKQILKNLSFVIDNILHFGKSGYVKEIQRAISLIKDDIIVFNSTKTNSLKIGNDFSTAYKLPDSFNLFKIAVNDNNTYIKKNGQLYSSISDLDNNYDKKDIKNRIALELAQKDCKVLVLNENSSLAKKIEKSNGLFAFILGHKNELSDKKQIISGEILFESNDSDLYASFHSAGVKNCKFDNNGNLTLQIVDFYNFNEGRTSVKGRVGRKLQELGDLEPYYIIVNVKVSQKMMNYFFNL